MNDTDFLYTAALEKRIEKIEAENAELKRLLRMAVEDIRKILASECACECDFCAYENNGEPLCAKFSNGSGSWCCENCKWIHADEALELIGGNENEL